MIFYDKIFCIRYEIFSYEISIFFNFVQIIHKIQIFAWKKWDTDVFQKFKNERWLSTRNLVRGSGLLSRKLGKLQLQVRKWKLLAAIETSIEQDWRCLSRTIDVIHCCRKIETLLIRRHFKFPFAAGPLVFDISTVNRIFFNIITCMLRTMIEPWILWGDDELNSPRDGYLHLLHGFTSMYFADESMITDKSTIVLFFFSFFFLIRFLSTYVFINLPVKL